MTGFRLVTVSDWASEFLIHCRVAKNLSPHSLRAYEIDLADFERCLGSRRPVDDIDRTDIRRFLSYLTEKRGLAPASVKRRIACLKAFFKWVELEGGVEITPFHRLDLRLRLPKKLPRALEIDDIARLRKAAARGIVDERGELSVTERPEPGWFDRFTGMIALELLYAMAVRVSELCSLDVQVIEEGAYRGALIKGKGNRERWVPLVDPALSDLLRKYVQYRRLFCARPSGGRQALLISSRSNPHSPASIRAYLARYSKEASIERAVTPHVIRHSAATHYLRAGLDLRHTQRLLGHSSVSTTEIYTAVSDKSLETAMQRLEL